MSFFIFSPYKLTTYEPLRLPMWGGELVTKDPEVRNATVRTNGGDEAYSGTLPSTSRQSVAEQGQMKPRAEKVEPDIDVKVAVKVYHLIDGETEEYVTTRFDFQAIAEIKVNGEKLYIISKGVHEDKIWDIAPEEIKSAIEKAESETAEKALNFLRARRELLDTLKAVQAEIALEKVVEEEYFYDDP